MTLGVDEIDMLTVGEWIIIMWGSILLLPLLINIVAFTEWKNLFKKF